MAKPPIRNTRPATGQDAANEAVEGIEPIETAEVERDYDEITYCPGDGDPARTTWNGLEFKSHIPTRVSKKHTILVPMPTEITAADGSVLTRHVEKRVPMAHFAKGNPHFMVNGDAPAARVNARARTPETPDEYRGYAMRWIAGSTEASAMDVRWSQESVLRNLCGVNDQDIAYLRPFFEARRDTLKHDLHEVV